MDINQDISTSWSRWEMLEKVPSTSGELRRQPLLYSKSRRFKADLIIHGDESWVFEFVWVAI